MSVKSNIHWGAACVVAASLFLGTSLLSPVKSFAGESRRVKTRVQPVYPDLARKGSIAGTVRIEAVITPGGDVKDAKVVGGHPLLGAAAVEAIKRWKYEPAPEQSTVLVEFNFHNGM